MSDAAVNLPPLPQGQEHNQYTQINIDHPLGQIFKATSYHIEQPFLQVLQEGYKIKSDDGSEVFNAVRKREVTKSFLVSLLIVIVLFSAIACGVIGFGIFSQMFGKETMKQLAPVYIVALIAVTWLISFSLSKLLMPKRMTNVYKGEDQSDKIFEIAPTSGYFLFNKEFHLKDSQNQTVLIYKRYFFHSIFRIKWNAYTPNGEYIFSCMEDSIPMAILRRYLNLGKLIPLHFILTKDGKTKFGDFKRKFSIKDKYKLDYEYHTAPGWIIIAAAILLDTGEKR